jgi:hypothetical protein
MRKDLALLAAIAALFTLMALRAQAMPAAPLKGAGKSDQTVVVRSGCGRGWYRGWRGRCYPN